MLKSLNDVVALAGGCVTVGLGTFNHEIAIASAVAASSLITQVATHAQRHGPEDRRALANARRAVRDAEDRWKHVSPETLDEWDLALKRLLPNCLLDRKALAKSAEARGGFPKAACALILDALAKQDGWQRGDTAASIGLGGKALDGAVFADGEARDFATDVITSALEATYHDQDYFKLIAPFLAFQLAETTGRIERKQDAGLDMLGDVLAEVAAMRRMMETGGLEDALKQRGFSEDALRNTARNFASIDASSEAKAYELRYAIDRMEDGAGRQDGVADQAMGLARMGDFVGASSLLATERKRLREAVEEQQALLDHLRGVSDTIERLQQDPAATARMIFDEQGSYEMSRAALSDGIVKEANRRMRLPSLFERQVAAELFELGLNHPEIRTFTHGRAWWGRNVGAALAAQAEFGGGSAAQARAIEFYETAERDSLQAMGDFASQGKHSHAEAAALDLAYTVNMRVRAAALMAYRARSVEPLKGLVAQVEKHLDSPIIAGCDRASALLHHSICEIFANAQSLTKDKSHAAEARQHIAKAIERIDRTDRVGEQIEFRLMAASQLSAAADKDVTLLTRAMLRMEEVRERAAQHDRELGIWPRYKHATLLAQLDYATGHSENVPRAIEAFRELLAEISTQERSRTWWDIELGLAYARATLAFRRNERGEYTLATEDLQVAHEQAVELGLIDPTVHDSGICGIAQKGREKNWPLTPLLDSYEPH